MYEYTFHLRQHTPLVHFLHDQPEATLRATELKPKLDNYLRKKIVGNNWNTDWEIKEDDKKHLSLDYKISIRPTGKRHDIQLDAPEKFDQQTHTTKYETTNYPNLLANMGGKEHREDLKNLILYNGAEIIIRSWHEELLTHIKTHLPRLLANTNFGNRSGKGFGSFTCTAVDGKPQQPHLAFRYCFDWKPEGDTEAKRQKDLFLAINWFYKCLRSGINQVNRNGETEFYFKSLMFAFAQQRGEKWDKYNIKNFFFTGGELPELKSDYRDWLGLSTEEMWGRKYGNQKITKDAKRTSLVDGKQKETEVERFASPLFFKPMRSTVGNDFKVYFGAVTDHDAFEAFSQATIKVHLKGKPDLELRPAANFNVDDFLRFALEEIDIEDHLAAFDRDNLNDTRYWIFRDFIQPIFASIRQNLPQNV